MRHALLPQVIFLAFASQLAAAEPKLDFTWVEYVLTSADPNHDRLRDKFQNPPILRDPKRFEWANEVLAELAEMQKPALNFKTNGAVPVGNGAVLSFSEGQAKLSADVKCQALENGRYALKLDYKFDEIWGPVAAPRGGRGIRGSDNLEVKPRKPVAFYCSHSSLTHQNADGSKVNIVRAAFVVVCLDMNEW